MSLALAPARKTTIGLPSSRGASPESESVLDMVLKLCEKHTVADTSRPRSVDERFRELTARWKRERGPSSIIRQLAVHPAYQQIIGLGLDAVPSILGELSRSPDWWFWALTAITGENPVDPEHNGKLRLMAADWLRWGHANGYSW